MSLGSTEFCYQQVRVHAAFDSSCVESHSVILCIGMVKGTRGKGRSLKPWLPDQVWGRLSDRRPSDCLCVSMGNGAGSLRPWDHPSVSRGVGLRGCMVCVTSKTNGQEVQPEKQQYLQNIYSEENVKSSVLVRVQI